MNDQRQDGMAGRGMSTGDEDAADTTPPETETEDWPVEPAHYDERGSTP